MATRRVRLSSTPATQRVIEWTLSRSNSMNHRFSAATTASFGLPDDVATDLDDTEGAAVRISRNVQVGVKNLAKLVAWDDVLASTVESGMARLSAAVEKES